MFEVLMKQTFEFNNEPIPCRKKAKYFLQCMSYTEVYNIPALR